MEIDRRELFYVIAAGMAQSPALTQEHQHGQTSSKINVAGYEPRALTPAQYKTLDALAEILLPAGDDDPGAHEAGVAFYLDSVLYYGDDSQRQFWRRGLDAAAGGQDLEGVVADWAKNEASPKTEGERFFVTFKSAAISAFYLSEAGRKSAGYKGDTAIASFPGCTHKEHQGPSA